MGTWSSSNDRSSIRCTRDLVGLSEQVRFVVQALEAAGANLAAREQESDRQIIALKREIELIHSSRTWSYGSFLQRLASLPNTAAFFAGRTVALRALHHLEGVPSGKRATEWTITGDRSAVRASLAGFPAVGSRALPAQRTCAGRFGSVDRRAPLRRQRRRVQRNRTDRSAVCSNGKGSGRGHLPTSRGSFETAFRSERPFPPRSRSTACGCVRLGRVEDYARLIGRIAAHHLTSPEFPCAVCRACRKTLEARRPPRICGHPPVCGRHEALWAALLTKGGLRFMTRSRNSDVAELRRQLAQIENDAPHFGAHASVQYAGKTPAGSDRERPCPDLRELGAVHCGRLLDETACAERFERICANAIPASKSSFATGTAISRKHPIPPWSLSPASGLRCSTTTMFCARTRWPR